jgi:hypothetical protein
MVTNPAVLSYLVWLSSEEETRQENIVLARDYYEGDHHITLTERQEEYLGFDADQKFSVNYAKVIVSAVAERLRVQGFTGDGTLAEFATAEWERARLRAQAKRVHRYSMVDGASFVIVDWHDGAPRYTVQRAYTDAQVDGTGDGCKAHYVNDDIYGELEYVTKRWNQNYWDADGHLKTRKRMTVYYPDRVEKYAMMGNGATAEATWQRYQDDGDASWPIPWVNRNGEPLGIAAVPFQNEDGASELTTEIIALQDGLNKVWLDILAAADRAGFGIYVSRGFWPTTDGNEPNSQNTNLIKIAPGVWIGTKDPAANVELIEAASLQPLLQVKDGLLFELARITGIPMSRFTTTAQVESGETLKQQESPLIAKTEDRQDLYGDAWENVFKLAARVQAANGGDEIDDDEILHAGWAPAETRDEGGELERAAQKVRELKIPYEVVWAELGYTDDEIEKMKMMEPYASSQALAQAALLLDEDNRGS